MAAFTVTDAEDTVTSERTAAHQNLSRARAKAKVKRHVERVARKPRKAKATVKTRTSGSDTAATVVNKETAPKTAEASRKMIQQLAWHQSKTRPWPKSTESTRS